MITKRKLARINALAKKSKTTGLTETEKEDQAQLRKEYLQNIRQSFTNQFSTMTVVDKEGKDVTPQKVKDLKKSNKSDEF